MATGKIEATRQAEPRKQGPLTEMGLRSRVVVAILVIGTFFGGFGLWSGFAPLQSGAIASGSVNVTGQRKTLQHLEGGIVDRLMVKEGQAVTSGQVLIRLSDTQALAQVQLLWGRLAASLAESSRLEAERDGQRKIALEPDILKYLGGNQAKHEKLIAAQRAIFQSRKDALKSQKDLTRQQVRQLQEEIGGLNAGIGSQERQLKLIKEEIEDLTGLLEKGFARKPRLLELRREEAALEGAKDQNVARIARARQAIIEAELGVVESKTKMMNEVVTQLRETQQMIADLKERVTASQDILSRMEIRAPVSGRVVDLQIFTKGGVIAPGAPIMDIVPEDKLLVIEARVDPIDIDVVHAGLEAEIRLLSFRTDEMPVIRGIVENVSADSLTDPRTGRSYYLARIVLAEGAELPKDKPLYPGMPAEVLIVTGQRTALSYLLDPITRSLNRSMRED